MKKYRDNKRKTKRKKLVTERLITVCAFVGDIFYEFKI